MKIHSNIRTSGMIAVVALALAPAAVWAGHAPKATEERGVIASVDATAHQLTITNQKAKADTFTWNEQTKFIEHGKSANANALKEGTTVDLTYTSTGGTRTLRHVKLAPAKSAKPVSASNGATANAP